LEKYNLSLAFVVNRSERYRHIFFKVRDILNNVQVARQLNFVKLRFISLFGVNNASQRLARHTLVPINDHVESIIVNCAQT